MRCPYRRETGQPYRGEARQVVIPAPPRADATAYVKIAVNTVRRAMTARDDSITFIVILRVPSADLPRATRCSGG
jgi:hypothetical protein